MNMRDDRSNDELIKAYIHESANETGPHPFGAEARRKALGDELLARGITEIELPAFERTFAVRGSTVDARKNTLVFSRTGR
jgi:hypothetical protein